MKSLKEYMFTGFIFVSILGTLFHFLYDLLGNNFFVGLFAARNESIFEHSKLVFFPTLLFLLYKNSDLKSKHPKINEGVLTGAVLGTFLIPVLFYTYSGALGFNVMVIDIAIFYISVAVAFLTAYKISISKRYNIHKNLLVAVVVVMAVLFVIFSIYPPNIALFASP